MVTTPFAGIAVFKLVFGSIYLPICFVSLALLYHNRNVFEIRARYVEFPFLVTSAFISRRPLRLQDTMAPSYLMPGGYCSWAQSMRYPWSKCVITGNVVVRPTRFTVSLLGRASSGTSIVTARYKVNILSTAVYSQYVCQLPTSCLAERFSLGLAYRALFVRSDSFRLHRGDSADSYLSCLFCYFG